MTGHVTGEVAVAPDHIDRAARLLGELAQRDVPLAPLTTYRVGGPAALFVAATSVDDLRAVAAARDASELPVLVIGRGSNLLIADRGFAGIVVSLGSWREGGPSWERSGDHDVVADAAMALPQLARRVAAAGLSGFEWAVGVPGSVGGAVRMNAGGHGGDMDACLVEADLFDLRSGANGWVASERLGLRFRGSDLAAHQIVIAARLRLAPGSPAASEAMIDDIVRWRREHQPGGQNAGSVFVNPIPGQLSAGELIDRVGLRGHRLRSASVSDKHANFIQGSEGGTAADVLELIELVRERVAAETGYVLRSEVRLVGFGGGLTDDGPGVSW